MASGLQQLGIDKAFGFLEASVASRAKILASSSSGISLR